MIALWRQRARKLNTHTLVFWLAVNDMLVGIFVIPSTLPSLFTKRQVCDSCTLLRAYCTCTLREWCLVHLFIVLWFVIYLAILLGVK